MTLLNALIDRLVNEPVLVTTFVGAVISLAVAYGAPISPDQKSAVIAAIIAAAALFARAKVTPV